MQTDLRDFFAVIKPYINDIYLNIWVVPESWIVRCHPALSSLLEEIAENHGIDMWELKPSLRKKDQEVRYVIKDKQ